MIDNYKLHTYIHTVQKQTWDLIKNSANAFKNPQITGSVTTEATFPNLKYPNKDSIIPIEMKARVEFVVLATLLSGITFST